MSNFSTTKLIHIFGQLAKYVRFGDSDVSGHNNVESVQICRQYRHFVHAGSLEQKENKIRQFVPTRIQT